MTFSRRRAAVGLADQFLSSAQNFSVMVVVARSTTARDFGAFTLALTLIALSTGLTQSLVNEPALLRWGGSLQAGHVAQANAVSSAWVCSAGLSILFGAASAALSPSPRAMVATVALVLPLLLVLEALRWASLSLGRSMALLAVDASWIFAWLVGLVLVRPGNAVSHLAVYGSSAALGVLVGAVLLRIRPQRLRVAWSSWRADGRGRAGWLLADFGSTQGASYLVSIAVTGIVGLADAGGLRAAQAVFGPLNSLVTGLRMALVPELLRGGGPFTRRGRRVLAAATAVATALTVVVGAGGMAVSTSFGNLVFGQAWPHVRLVLLPVFVARIAGALMVRAIIALRASGGLALMARVRAAAAMVSAPVGVSAAWMWGVQGAAWALAGLAIGTWLAMESVVSKAARSPNGPPLPVVAATNLKGALS